MIVSWVPQLVYKMKSFILEAKSRQMSKYTTSREVQQNHQSYLDVENIEKKISP